MAFICHTVVWGLMWTIGIWTTQFENVFGQSKAYASLIGSGLNATNYVAGEIFQEVYSDYSRDPIKRAARLTIFKIFVLGISLDRACSLNYFDKIFRYDCKSSF